MKFRTMSRHLREGTKNISRNGWMTVASLGAVTTTLFLVGLFLVIMLNLNQVVNNVEKDVEIKVLIDLTAQQDDINKMKNRIQGIDGVSTVKFSSKDKELESLKGSMGNDGDVWELFEQENPLNNAFIVKTTNPLDTMKVAKQIKRFDSVTNVVYGKDVVKRLFSFNKYARYVGLILILGLLFTAIFLISNTIKITIFARRNEVGIMKLVGATNNFIRWPFFIEGLILGGLGSVIPIAVVVAGYYFLTRSLQNQITIPFFKLLPFDPLAWRISIILLFLGVCIGVWGSVMSIRKFLKV